jgi:hypothetical protein
LNDRKSDILVARGGIASCRQSQKMVVDAVWCERVSRPVSLLYAKKTGKIAEKRGHLPGSTRKVADLARYSLAPAKSEQGT